MARRGRPVLCTGRRLSSLTHADYWLAADAELLAAESALAPPAALPAGLQAAHMATTAIINAHARSRELRVRFIASPATEGKGLMRRGDCVRSRAAQWTAGMSSRTSRTTDRFASFNTG
ncbi:hypothetical protein CIC12_11905 [Burkholderia sp. SG-MS1]|nr:hypothetical protein [Paraburkholderia sp. SG-MS1]